MKAVEVIDKLHSVSTPCYFYDMELFEQTLEAVAKSAQEFGIEVHYALKANYEKKLLKYISGAGFGADCVSGGEICLCRETGFDMSKLVFAGVGKTDEEIEIALDNSIGCFNVESLEELSNINSIAGRKNKIAPVCLRVNPNIDAHTHKYITTGLEENKFGISDYLFDDAIECVKSYENVKFLGLQFHIGSQILDVDKVFSLECTRVKEILEYFESKGLKVSVLDLGGGLGIDYEHPDRNPIPDFRLWFSVIRRELGDVCDGRRILVEPGRSIVGQCGTLISKVTYVKQTRTKQFVILDAGMNNLIRPALYEAFHKIENLDAVASGYPNDCEYDVVGPICESADVFAENRPMPRTVRGDIVAIRSVGAYGSVMSSNYNLHHEAKPLFSDELNK